MNCFPITGRIPHDPMHRYQLNSLKHASCIHRCITTTANASTPTTERLQQLFNSTAPQQQPPLLLERAIGAQYGADEQLWNTGSFIAGVYPDLPVATSWKELADSFLGQRGGGGSSRPQTPRHNQLQPHHPSSSSSRWTVQTIAAQCRSQETLETLIKQTCNSTNTNSNYTSADALLLLSGGHPARRLPGANLLLNDSFKLLKLASYLKSTQQIPNTVSLWAVENPLVSPPSRIKAKVEAGADVVLTQPPLLPDQSASFFEQAAADGTMEKAKIIIGVPMAPSVRNLDFWLRLADARNLPEAEAVLNSFPRQTNNNGGDGKEKGGAEEEEEYWNTVKEWNVEFIRGSLKIPGVAGLHVMPLTAAARKMTMELLQEGAFSVI